MKQILIEPDQLNSWMSENKPVVVDTRSPDAYDEYHIPGAVNIHDIFTYLASSTPEGMAEMRAHFAEVFGLAGIDQDDTVVFYEQGMGTGFGQSCRGHFMLSYLGHHHSFVLHGGLQAWIDAGYQITDQHPEYQPKSFLVNDAGLDLIVGKQQVLDQLGKDQVTLLDVRDVDEWIATSSSPYGKDFVPRKGRIPGAKWLEWYRMMKPSGKALRVKDPDEVRAECLNIGLDFDKPIWLYCFKGARTSNTYVALKQAGFTKISTYFGSWNEWARDVSLPIEEGFPER